MRKLLLIVLCLFTFTSNPDNLFDNIIFKRGISVKRNIPVIYHCIGKTGKNELVVFSSFGKCLKSNSSLYFSHNDNKYYLPIANNAFPIFLNDAKEGDTLQIDIVIFDTINNYACNKSVKNYYAYISRITN